MYIIMCQISNIINTQHAQYVPALDQVHNFLGPRLKFRILQILLKSAKINPTKYLIFMYP